MNSSFRIFLYFINIILYFVIIALWIAIPDELTLDLSASIFCICMTLLLMYQRRATLEKFYLSSRFKSFTNALVGAFLVCCILGVINYLFYKHPFHFDFSKFETNSLTVETNNVIKKTKGPITFKIFSRVEDAAAIKALLELYRLQKSDIEIIFINIELRPDLVKMNSVEKNGTIVVEYNGKKQLVDDSAEIAITNALIRLSRNSDPIIYFSQGHGEISFNDSSKNGLSKLFKTLKSSIVSLILFVGINSFKLFIIFSLCSIGILSNSKSILEPSFEE